MGISFSIVVNGLLIENLPNKGYFMGGSVDLSTMTGCRQLEGPAPYSKGGPVDVGGGLSAGVCQDMSSALLQ